MEINYVDAQQLLRYLVREMAAEANIDTDQLASLQLRRFYYWLCSLDSVRWEEVVAHNPTVSLQLIRTLQVSLNDPFVFMDFVNPFWSYVRHFEQPPARMPAIVHASIAVAYLRPGVPDNMTPSQLYDALQSQFNGFSNLFEIRTISRTAPIEFAHADNKAHTPAGVWACIDEVVSQVSDAVHAAGLVKLQPPAQAPVET